jgi:hypothetical protein
VHDTLKSGCQGWTCTNTVRFNKPACYFDTTWQCPAESMPTSGKRTFSLIRLRPLSLWLFQLEAKTGAAGRILTCIIPFRRRMPDIFDHGSKLKLVSAAGVAPGACARPPTPVPSRVRWLLSHALVLRAIFKNAGVEKRKAETLGISLAVRFEIGGPEGTCSRRGLHPIRGH